MIIKSAAFVTSNSEVEKCPPPLIPEVAFIGRSNVGKSSLINMLTGYKKLAKTSGTPGKTQLINHFLINESFYVVDLPGYGFAKVDKKTLAVFDRMIKGYLQRRENLMNIFILIDIRHEALKADLQFINWLGENDVPLSIIFTKADKLKPSEVERNLKAYKETLLEYWDELPPIFVSSSDKGTGREEVLGYIAELCTNF